MIDVEHYLETERLKDGREIRIRAQRPDDREGFREAFARVSTQTVYHRFFAAKRHFSVEEEHHFLDIDYVSQVALIAETVEHGHRSLIGSCRYIVTDPGRAEVSFMVIDEYQGLGIGGLLFDHLARIARQAGLKEFVAEVLADNRAMLRVFERSGLISQERRDGTVVDITMPLMPEKEAAR